METGSQGMAHKIVLDERRRLSVTGVEEVESFDESCIVMSTGKGTLVVRGDNLHIETLSLDGGGLKVDGDVDSLTYEDAAGEKTGLFARLFR